jgi:hypothetical protein
MSASLAINDAHQRVNIPILMYHDIRSVGQPITPPYLWHLGYKQSRSS